ncbi:hypothetical protein JIN84_15905 [Luteolibacter yonseiensis]|uniref:RedB protein n=1 Tax=Luteolibacter yonseiensis TaxID=1144680 RepID=A0A934VD24_9BACT|nr:hypothetical protein [Luteolibacter yonseiensis]MBK1817104.1 hypothetical protein [Luteolibacter yonseiensis]
MKKQSFHSGILAAVIWLLVVVGGMGALMKYSMTPGPATGIPTSWPVSSRIALDVTKPNLILFAHPHCPCTAATIGELEILMNDRPGRLNAQVWFIKPEGVSKGWEETALWRKASAIPGVTVHRDDDLSEAKRFHAGTSGLTLVYAPDGHLLFQGGITLSRGHAGDNAGRDAIMALLDQKQPQEFHTPAYGCPLSGDDCQPEQTVCKP